MTTIDLHSSMEAVSSYCSNALALTRIEESTHRQDVHHVLARNNTPFLRLIAGRHQFGQHGLSDRQRPAQLRRGPSDHAASGAFYCTDREGNGIELDTDRPRESWSRDSKKIRMTTLGRYSFRRADTTITWQ